MGYLHRIESPTNQYGIAHLVVPCAIVVLIALIGGFVYLHSGSAATKAEYFVSNVSGKCLDDSYDGKANYTKVQLYTCNKSSAQQWTVNTNGTIENANGACLDLSGAATVNNTKIAMYACNTNEAQQWKVMNNTLINPHSSKCIDDPYSAVTNNTQLILYTCKGTSNQIWTPTEISTGTSVPPTTVRMAYQWPFTWDSIWNMPISSSAQYVTSGIKVTSTYQNVGSSDYDSVDPSFPLKTLTNGRLANGSTGAVSVHVDPAMTAGGEWNTCSAFLGSDEQTVYQGQTTQLNSGGNPSFSGTDDVTWPTISLESNGSAGCHGGSSLSGLGGTLTDSDITGNAPIQHVLKVMFNGYINYSNKNGGFRWPATVADYGYNISGNVNYYDGNNPDVVEGSLMALPPTIIPTSFSDPLIQKLATALQDYGAYIVDNTAGGPSDASASVVTNYNANTDFNRSGDFAGELNTLLMDLEVVNNNTASTPGGGPIGSSRYATYAPTFSDGSDVPPAVTVVKP
jgi:hypothetical protein